MFFALKKNMSFMNKFEGIGFYQLWWIEAVLRLQQNIGMHFCSVVIIFIGT